MACRQYGEKAAVPEYLDGHPVIELAPYAFSDSNQAREESGAVWAADENCPADQGAPFLSGERLTEITLPKSLEKIGNYAFYNCYELESVCCYSAVSDIGFGVFTGCGRIARLHIRMVPQVKSCLKEMLAELRQELLVIYTGQEGEAELWFPGYYEEALENTPARITMTEVHGCGQRYRYCFDGTEFVFKDYDALFPRASALEPEQLVLRLALGRLYKPVRLSQDARELYERFVSEHFEAAAREALGRRDRRRMIWFTERFAFRRDQLELMIRAAGRRNDPESLSYLMNDLHRRFGAEKRKFTLERRLP